MKSPTSVSSSTPDIVRGNNRQISRNRPPSNFSFSFFLSSTRPPAFFPPAIQLPPSIAAKNRNAVSMGVGEVFEIRSFRERQRANGTDAVCSSRRIKEGRRLEKEGRFLLEAKKTRFDTIGENDKGEKTHRAKFWTVVDYPRAKEDWGALRVPRSGGEAARCPLR